jgi:DNA-binding beta-propeller fold protein YncE
MAISPIRTMQVQNTSGIAFSRDGFFVVVEWNNNSYSSPVITRMLVDVEGHFSADDQCPGVGMAITQDNFVLLCNRKGIVKISMDGSIVASVDREEIGLYGDKNDLGLSPVTGQIYVVDCRKHNIKVLNPDLTFKKNYFL